MVSTRSLTNTLLLCLSASLTTSAATLKTSTTSKAISTKTSKTHTKTATTSTSSASATPSPTRDQDCDGQGAIIRPTSGSTIYLPAGGGSGYVEVVYCSIASVKIRSLHASVLLGDYSGEPSYGTVLALDQQADDLDAAPGYDSYRFNVSVDATRVQSGVELPLTVFEETTGYYTPYLYNWNTINVTFQKNATSS